MKKLTVVLGPNTPFDFLPNFSHTPHIDKDKLFRENLKAQEFLLDIPEHFDKDEYLQSPNALKIDEEKTRIHKEETLKKVLP